MIEMLSLVIFGEGLLEHNRTGNRFNPVYWALAFHKAECWRYLSLLVSRIDGSLLWPKLKNGLFSVKYSEPDSKHANIVKANLSGISVKETHVCALVPWNVLDPAPGFLIQSSNVALGSWPNIFELCFPWTVLHFSTICIMYYEHL